LRHGENIQVLEYVDVSPVYTVDLGDGLLVLSLIAPAASLDATFKDVQDTFLYSQGMFSTLFADQPSVDGDDGPPRARSNANDAGAEYLSTIAGTLDTLTESIDDFSNVLADPSLGDEATLDQVTAILDIWA